MNNYATAIKDKYTYRLGSISRTNKTYFSIFFPTNSTNDQFFFQPLLFKSNNNNIFLNRQKNIIVFGDSKKRLRLCGVNLLRKNTFPNTHASDKNIFLQFCRQYKLRKNRRLFRWARSKYRMFFRYYPLRCFRPKYKKNKKYFFYTYVPKSTGKLFFCQTGSVSINLAKKFRFIEQKKKYFLLAKKQFTEFFLLRFERFFFYKNNFYKNNRITTFNKSLFELNKNYLFQPFHVRFFKVSKISQLSYLLYLLNRHKTKLFKQFSFKTKLFKQFSFMFFSFLSFKFMFDKKFFQKFNHIFNNFFKGIVTASNAIKNSIKNVIGNNIYKKKNLKTLKAYSCFYVNNV